jgi:hypothetical protein
MRGVDNPPHLASRLKIEYSVATTLIPLWVFIVYYRVNFYLLHGAKARDFII